MAGNKAGGQKTRQTILEKYGADFYKRVGSIGGKAGTGHAFAHGKVSPSEAGKIGGKRKNAKG